MKSLIYCVFWTHEARVIVAVHTRGSWPSEHRGDDFDVIGRSGSVEGQLPNAVARIRNVQQR
jgi:hypothetical protein